VIPGDALPPSGEVTQLFVSFRRGVSTSSFESVDLPAQLQKAKENVEREIRI
jgi:hypothetical protein